MLGTFPNHSQAKRVIIDIETYDPDLKNKGVSYTRGQGFILGVGIKLDNSLSMYYPLRHEDGKNCEIDQVYRYLKDLPETALVGGHNFIYDAGWIYHESGWLHSGQFFDTMLEAQLENNNRESYSLKALANQFNLGNKVEIEIQNLRHMPIRDVAVYCCQDVDLTAMLDNNLWRIRSEPAALREFAIIPLLVKMKKRGIKIDVEALDVIESNLRYELNKHLEIFGENIWSGKAVAQVFDSLGIKYPRTEPSKHFPEGNPSFPKWFREGIDHPKIKALNKARELDKIVNTFCANIKEYLTFDNRLHPDFFNVRSEEGGTVTGRFSSAHINIQQIPNRTEEGKLLRSIFIPDEGYILGKFDYKQQEPILMLHYASKLGLSGIQKWREIYQDPNADFYIPIQQAMQIDRFSAKTISLARSYNMGPEKLSRMSHISMREAIGYLIDFDNTVPWLKELKKHCIEKAEQRGFIYTVGGRKLFFNRADVSVSFNHLIQGSAADQTKQAMIDVYDGTGLIPLLQVHDELLYQLTDEQVNNYLDNKVEELMVKAIPLDFPVRVDKKLGMNWMECA